MGANSKQITRLDWGLMDFSQNPLQGQTIFSKVPFIHSVLVDSEILNARGDEGYADQPLGHHFQISTRAHNDNRTDPSYDVVPVVSPSKGLIKSEMIVRSDKTQGGTASNSLFSGLHALLSLIWHGEARPVNGKATTRPLDQGCGESFRRK